MFYMVHDDLNIFYKSNLAVLGNQSSIREHELQKMDLHHTKSVFAP